MREMEESLDRVSLLDFPYDSELVVSDMKIFNVWSDMSFISLRSM